MPEEEIQKAKERNIEIYGNMRLSMKLHDLGWIVFSPVFEDDYNYTIIQKLWCPKCKKYSNQFIHNTKYGKSNAKCVTNLCEHCKKTELTVVSRYLQVKTSEGKATNDERIREFSFHPKIRYDMGDDVFYVWIAVFDDKSEKRCHFYIFNTKDVKKFDNILLDTYQITDNQKTTLKIRDDGCVLNKGKIYDYSIFNTRFNNDWSALELEKK